jgi:hypothetical protein
MQALAKESSAALNLANLAMKRSFDKHHRDIPPLLPDSLVLLDGKGIDIDSPSRKLADKRHGPFKVVERIGEVSYRIKLPDSWKIHDVFHISKLTPFIAPSFPSQSANPVTPTLNASFDKSLQSILTHKNLRRKSIFLSLLAGEDQENARWLSQDELSLIPDPDNVLASYLTSCG